MIKLQTPIELAEQLGQIEYIAKASLLATDNNFTYDKMNLEEMGYVLASIRTIAGTVKSALLDMEEEMHQ